MLNAYLVGYVEGVENCVRDEVIFEVDAQLAEYILGVKDGVRVRDLQVA